MADPIHELAAKLEPQVRRAFLDAVWDIRSAAKLQTLIGHLEVGNVGAAITALNLREEFFEPLDRALSNAFLQGGTQALSGIPEVTAPFQAALASVSDFRADTSGPNELQGKSEAG